MVKQKKINKNYNITGIKKIAKDQNLSKDAIFNDPEKLKEKIKTNPELSELFSGINIDALSIKLREIAQKHGGEPNA